MCLAIPVPSSSYFTLRERSVQGGPKQTTSYKAVQKKQAQHTARRKRREEDHIRTSFPEPATIRRIAVTTVAAQS